jgi:hypothetical protein
MQIITWGYLCHVCQRPIQSGRPTVLFAADRPLMVGICHSTCGYGQHNYGHFQMCPPDYLTEDQISFLVPLYFSLLNLPGGLEPKGGLRVSLAFLLRDYPFSMVNLMASFKKCLEENKKWSAKWQYEGDLERDFLRILGDIDNRAREMPTGIEINFRKR